MSAAGGAFIGPVLFALWQRGYASEESADDVPHIFPFDIETLQIFRLERFAFGSSSFQHKAGQRIGNHLGEQINLTGCHAAPPSGQQNGSGVAQLYMKSRYLLHSLDIEA